MKLEDAIELIRSRKTSLASKQSWADLGSGTGLFTLALAELLAPGSKIYAVDKSATALGQLHSTPDVTIEKIISDFATDKLHLNNLDGMVMANSLHFIKDKYTLVNNLKAMLKDDGCFVVVEYDMEKSNPWVPYPIPYDSLIDLFEACGFHSASKLHERPSVYNNSMIYSALVEK
jgi:ubiquinone/menaquinone biosynthesis C-methylase UbiE